MVNMADITKFVSSIRNTSEEGSLQEIINSFAADVLKNAKDVEWAVNIASECILVAENISPTNRVRIISILHDAYQNVESTSQTIGRIMQIVQYIVPYILLIILSVIK